LARSAAEIVVASRAGRHEHQIEISGACSKRPTVGARKHLGFDRKRHTFGGARASQLRVELAQGECESFDILLRARGRYVEVGGQDRCAGGDRGDRADDDVADVVRLERAQDLAGFEVGDVSGGAQDP
jgi:hypothetical protein